MYNRDKRFCRFCNQRTPWVVVGVSMGIMGRSYFKHEYKCGHCGEGYLSTEELKEKQQSIQKTIKIMKKINWTKV